AAGDALATVKLFEILLSRDNEINGARSDLIRNTRISKLHPQLDLSTIENIPEEPGIYYFYNDRGDLIYIGKSRDLKQRIYTHLSNNTTGRAMEMRDMIAAIDYEVTGSELVALLRESSEIKACKPLFNRAQRRALFQWGIYSYTDEKGYLNFTYKHIDNEDVPLSVFSTREKARSKLASLVEYYQLCQKLSGLYETDGACFHHHVGLCRGACCGLEAPGKYNERASQAAGEFVFSRRNFFIIDSGRNEEERSAIKIVNGKYAGYGYFNIGDMGFGLSALHDCIVPSPDNRDIQVIIKQYLRSNKVGKIIDF
ncbi:MAG TPA: GIY-YIG nuclease family protein, partial [Bacteroidales bacterium]|nr:GIY-YIG nuclease family protein [Bacteroidales bacterium]